MTTANTDTANMIYAGNIAAVEDAIGIAYGAYDAGQLAIAAQAMTLAIKAAKGDRALLKDCANAMAWLFPVI